MNVIPRFTSVYGPVQSWRLGRSLGIDPIGPISTCSFNCAYCQLGEIEHQSCDRQLFVPTQEILQDLQPFSPWDVDAISLSGSGEPTLAVNLGEILTEVKALTEKPVAVFTNGSLLNDAPVRQELAIADQVAIKIDAISNDQLRRINRPAQPTDLPTLWTGFQLFREMYSGHLAIQTMLLYPWNDNEQDAYVWLMQVLAPNEIQLNTPTRPKPLNHELDARGNHSAVPYPAQYLKPVGAEVLRQFSDRIQQATRIPVRTPYDLL